MSHQTGKWHHGFSHLRNSDQHRSYHQISQFRMEKEILLKKPNKRTNYLEWQDYFMSIAFLSAQRSKDPRTQVGACIVNRDNKVVGIGYNGMPIGCSDDLMPWNRAENGSKEMWLESKAPYVCHAELNAVLNKNSAEIKGCIIYVALFPCNMCAQIIIQSGISEVVYYSDKYHDRPEFKASRFLLNTAGVKYRQHCPQQKKIIIDFDLIEGTPEEILSQPVVDSCTNTEVTTNNNNSGVVKTTVLENHPEQQQLQQINQLQAQFPRQPSGEWRQIPVSLLQSNETMEFNFAIVSVMFLVFVAVLSWYLSHAKLVVITH